jgi:hypothetical protein
MSNEPFNRRAPGRDPTLTEVFLKTICLGCKNGLFPPGNPSIKVGGFAPHLN